MQIGSTSWGSYERLMPAYDGRTSDRTQQSDLASAAAGGRLPDGQAQPGSAAVDGRSAEVTGRTGQVRTADRAEAPAKVDGSRECQTCKHRKYTDRSSDPTVSFQSPTSLNPEAAPTAVRAHEQEHVVHEQARARENGQRVVAQSVTIHYAVCPECGRPYVSGGTTTTTTKPQEQTNYTSSGKGGGSSTGGVVDCRG